MGDLSVLIEGFIPMPILRWMLNLVKMQIPQPSWRVIPISLFLFGDNWSLRFSVRWLRLAHFFIFYRKTNETNEETTMKRSNKLYTIAIISVALILSGFLLGKILGMVFGLLPVEILMTQWMSMIKKAIVILVDIIVMAVASQLCLKLFEGKEISFGRFLPAAIFAALFSNFLVPKTTFVLTLIPKSLNMLSQILKFGMTYLFPVAFVALMVFVYEIMFFAPQKEATDEQSVSFWSDLINTAKNALKYAVTPPHFIAFVLFLLIVVLVLVGVAAPFLATHLNITTNERLGVCDYCDGTGIRYDEICDVCKGKGFVNYVDTEYSFG